MSEILTLKKTGILPSMMRGRSALMIFLGLIIGLNAVSTDEASAKRRRKSKKKKVVESSLDPEVIKGAKSVFTALAGTSNGQARLAVVQGLIELGGADREEGLTQADSWR